MPIILYLIILSAIFPSKKYFEGQVTYSYQHITQNPGIPQNELEKQMLYDSAVDLFSRYEYKSVFFKKGKFVASLTYHNESKRVYEESAGKEYITYYDSRKPNMLAYPISLERDSTENILGYSCYLVRTKNMYGDVYSYYAADLKLDPLPYENHTMSLWNELLRLTDGSIPLKTISRYNDYIEIKEATRVVARKVKKDELKMTEGKLIVANQLALDSPAQMLPWSEETEACYRSNIDVMAERYHMEYIPKTVAVTFVLSKEGKISHVAADDYVHSEWKFWAMKIFSECSFQIRPGLLDGRPVASHVSCPIELKF